MGIRVWCYLASSWNQHILFQAAVEIWKMGLISGGCWDDCQCCFWAWVDVARCRRGHVWPAVRGLGRSEAWGGRWHPQWWQLLDLLLCHSHCSHLACASWLCASPLGLSGTGSNEAFQPLRNYHSLHLSLAASDVSLYSGTFEGFDRACASLSHVGFLQVSGLPEGFLHPEEEEDEEAWAWLLRQSDMWVVFKQLDKLMELKHHLCNSSEDTVETLPSQCMVGERAEGSSPTVFLRFLFGQGSSWLATALWQSQFCAN